ncbi:uncharacterized protein LOC122642721 isoform X2 [Telopea speciosissima]|uniref:uncharacterized protein LOC122642721 isoform X2 n=1 Tax=Telopea speciosissima TaxID=54955 RepID=UPI001CC656A4|nr:uncharacterized protein LOC122642721 isoform X2 [Telopea speciosissima]
MQTQRLQTWEQQQAAAQMQPQVKKNSGNIGSESPPKEDNKYDEEDMSRSAAITTFRTKEEEIERKKMEVKEKVQAQLGRVEEETKRLAEINEELEALADPTRKEVASIRKKIDAINRELKPLGQSCQKKEKEYKEALEAFNEKNAEKAQLTTKLMEMVSESERLRMKKLEELSKNIDTLQ